MVSRTLVAALSGVVIAVCSGPARADTDFVLLDANHDGALSRDEAGWQPVVTARFDRLDRDRDGALSRAEFAALELDAPRAKRDPAPPPANRRSSSGP